MQPSPDILARNLTALCRTSPAAVKLLAAAQPRSDVTWTQSPEGPAASISEWGELGPGFGEPLQRPLCSRRRPMTEANSLAETVDISAAAAIVVLGFGCGHHIAALARKLKKTGVLIVFEPDVPLLRSVLETIDTTSWINASNIVLITSATDDAQITQALAGTEAFLAMGTATLEHAPSRARLAGQGLEFLRRFTVAMKAIRTTMITTLAQSRATVRNLTQNIDHYVLGPGIAPLRRALAGRAAIVVSAGPSLDRNLALLEDPIRREQFCIIAAQTVLRPLICRGIRPHFVAALDYHELSARFYEGLTPQQLAGVTLIVEPKVNPAVTSAFASAAGIGLGSSRLRCVSDPILNELIGPELSKPMGNIESGATVAHLAYYLARYFGCDPVIMIGQDLGFTGGRYYASGAAIHDTWAPELNHFNTLEMHEWQRIVRMRSLLRPMPDHAGRTIYSDEQMATYLSQFQRDFAKDAQAGLLTIDATEGGVRKQHTTVMPLAQAIADHRPQSDAPTIATLLAACEPNAICNPASTTTPPATSSTKSRLARRLTAVAEDARRIAKGSDQAADLLGQMLEYHADQDRVGALIGEVYRIRDRVTQLQPAYATVERMNQSGAFNRYRADRAMHTADQPDELQQQASQIGRDIANVRSIAECADHLHALLRDAEHSLNGRSKIVRESLAELARIDRLRQPTVVTDPAKDVGIGATLPLPDESAPTVIGIVIARRQGSPLGSADALSTPFAPAATVLAVTASRLLQTAGITRIVVATDDAPWAACTLGPLAANPSVIIMHCEPAAGLPLCQFDPAIIRAARGPAAECWRSGISGLTIFDECFAPAVIERACKEHQAHAALLVDGAWPLIDPTLCAQIVERYKEDRSSHRISFTQAAPGLCGIVIDSDLCRQLLNSTPIAGLHSSIGGLLSYVPVAPMNDPISRSMCVAIDPAVRDVPVRLCIDSPQQAMALRTALERRHLSTASSPAVDIARAVASALSEGELSALIAADIELDLTGPTSNAAALSLLDPPAVARERVHITVDDAGDSAGLVQLIASARQQGSIVHLRTSLLGGEPEAARLLALAPDIISIDLHATDRSQFITITQSLGLTTSAQHATGAWDARCQGLDLLCKLVVDRGSTPALPLIVPRLAKCDATVDQVEDFYDQAIMRFGWAVIDGPPPALTPPAALAPARALITPLAEPALISARRRLSAQLHTRQLSPAVAQAPRSLPRLESKPLMAGATP